MLLPDPDRPLFDAWRSGDRRAGDELFQRYFDDLNRFFRGKVNDNVIEELIHDSFLRCLNSIDRFSGQSTFRAYLFGIVRHVFLDHLRARYRRDWRTVSLADIHERALEDVAQSPVSQIAETQEMRLFARALRQIPLDAQILFELHIWQKLTGPELAEALGVPEGTIRSRLAKAKRLHRAKMAELASSPEELARTISGFDTWAARVRANSPWLDHARS